MVIINSFSSLFDESAKTMQEEKSSRLCSLLSIMWNPKTKLEKKGIELHGHKNNTKEQHLDESPWPKQRTPFVFVPPCRCKLAQCSFHLGKNTNTKVHKYGNQLHKTFQAQAVHGSNSPKPFSDSASLSSRAM
ncbi:hypothetical protein C4D60_Mb01t10940 [Musa balbisiana]|uniref:Uncharacterized protein n=1 Tax=Musa balbisiana TaxID=52838 RepID=A0A4V4H798_MUSBA|nr:hypothetical protein C4D60_Mb01t10940 [Musa balbisiana]